jgi:hypothetical protein
VPHEPSRCIAGLALALAVTIRPLSLFIVCRGAAVQRAVLGAIEGRFPVQGPLPTPVEDRGTGTSPRDGFAAAGRWLGV